MSELKDIKALSPSLFFNIYGQISFYNKDQKKKESTMLPELGGLTGSSRLIRVSINWDFNGLYLHVYPLLEVEKGARFEVFIDTRDLKNSHLIHQFCHHFVFDLDQQLGIEKTVFRSDQVRPLASSKDLIVDRHQRAMLSLYYKIFLKKHALYGYNPESFKRLGLCFLYKTASGEVHDFNISSDYCRIEKHPALWASMELIT